LPYTPPDPARPRKQSFRGSKPSGDLLGKGDCAIGVWEDEKLEEVEILHKWKSCTFGARFREMAQGIGAFAVQSLRVICLEKGFCDWCLGR